MSRKFPRFLFSNPTNTKSKGPFVFHTIAPHVICSISDQPFNNEMRPIRKIVITSHFVYNMFLLSKIEKDISIKESEKIPAILDDMAEWIKTQIISGQITF